MGVSGSDWKPTTACVCSRRELSGVVGSHWESLEAWESSAQALTLCHDWQYGLDKEILGVWLGSKLRVSSRDGSRWKSVGVMEELNNNSVCL